MAYRQRYKGVIWTNHAIERMRERSVTQGDAWATWRRPDFSREAETDGAYIYYRTFSNRKIEVVAKKNQRGEWVVISVWAKEVEQKTKKRDGMMVGFIKRVFGL